MICTCAIYLLLWSIRFTAGVGFWLLSFGDLGLVSVWLLCEDSLPSVQMGFVLDISREEPWSHYEWSGHLGTQWFSCMDSCGCFMSLQLPGLSTVRLL